MKLISIIVPAFNAEQTLPRCLDSIHAQHFANLEAILINDGSSDRTAAILDTFAASRPKGTVQVVHSPNRGVAAARNQGIALAQGELVLFLDADDALPPDAIQTLYQGHLTSGAKLVIGGFDRIHGRNLEANARPVFTQDTTLDMPAIVSYCYQYLDRPNKHDLFVYCWGRLFARDLLIAHGIRFDERLRTFEDVLFNFQVLGHLRRLHYVAQCTYHHTVHDGAASQSVLAVDHPDGLTGFVAALEQARRFLEVHCADRHWVTRWVGQAYVTYTIVHLVRLCVRLRLGTLATTRAACRTLIDLPQFRSALARYVPAAGDSRLLPILMARRWAALAMLVAAIKARRRYRARA